MLPYLVVFLALLAAYMVYSGWTGLDPRLPVAGALALLVVTAVVDALGDSSAANTFAEYVFFLLAGGVVLLLFAHVKETRARPLAPGHPGGPPAEAADERHLAPEKTFDDPEQQPVAVVDAPGEDDHDHERSRDRQSDRDERPSGDDRREHEERDAYWDTGP